MQCVARTVRKSKPEERSQGPSIPPTDDLPKEARLDGGVVAAGPVEGAEGTPGRVVDGRPNSQETFGRPATSIYSKRSTARRVFGVAARRAEVLQVRVPDDAADDQQHEHSESDAFRHAPVLPEPRREAHHRGAPVIAKLHHRESLRIAARAA